jgi:hypothetical protein
MDFPCSVHKGSYEVSKIAVDANELKEFKADGWITSAEWYVNILGIEGKIIEEAPKRGRRPKIEE